jgi:hypothetical protein
MKPKLTIDDLNDPEKFELFASVDQSRIKEFVLQQVMSDKKIIPIYMIYQTLLFLTGIFFFTRAIVLAYRGNFIYLLLTMGAVLFSFTLLVAIHELLHGIALKLAGAPKVTFGGIIKKFIFFAEAENFILGKRSFLFVAFTPFVVMQVVTILGIIFWYSAPLLFFFLSVMVIHSFFCSGDVALVTIFYRFPGRDTFMYDNSAEKKSFYFVRKM